MANPVGEEDWLSYLEGTAAGVTGLEDSVNLIELYKRAVSAERGSLHIWLAYCNYFWSLWSQGQPDTAAWTQDEQAMARELFTFDSALDLWQQGYEAVKGRINDSHRLWNRWISLEMEMLRNGVTQDGVKRITHLYRARLMIPHLAWEETSQMFSGFLSEYNRAAWEETMKEVTSNAQKVKRIIDQRDPFELKLKQAERTDNIESQRAILTEYLDWEIVQTAKYKGRSNVDFDPCDGLFTRALTGILSFDETTWRQYIVFLSSSQSASPVSEHLLATLFRAVQHCPWSGQLWNMYILCAEEANLPFTEVEAIKHSATSKDQLYRNGMDSMIEMYEAWCGFLKRTAMDANFTDEAVDVADVGLAAALEDVAVVGNRLYGNDFQGDPKFRLEHIYIQYLTERKGALEEARTQWKKLAKVQIHADSYEFWSRYYTWEMLVFSSARSQNHNSPRANHAMAGAIRVPSQATAVLRQAVARTTIDWPEKIFEVYLKHCNDYETPHAVREATVMVYKAQQKVTKRRNRERQDAAAYTAYYNTQATGGEQCVETSGSSQTVDALATGTHNNFKRKREPLAESDNVNENATKRQKNVLEGPNAQVDDPQGRTTKRDRENTTILVTNLPEDATQTKVRQYFREYGHINNITAFLREDDGKSSTALIEFRTSEEAQSALLRNGKYFGQSQLSVQPGHDLTVYLANFPPSAGEQFIRDLFSDSGPILSIRWPSLKVNTHRRFCYVSFRDRQASEKAVQKDGIVLEGRYKLVSKYSDPGNKKRREGAVAEGREVHITNLHKNVTEKELREVFMKLGNVTRVNIPQSLSGAGRGFAFLDFETKEEAESAAREMHNVKFRNQIIQVNVSKDSKVKPSAKSFHTARESASPGPLPHEGESETKMMDTNGEARMPAKPSSSEIEARTVALMGLPDTVNDTRVRALVEPLGTIVRLVLQPAHGSAKIEFADAVTAGKAAMQLDGMAFENNKLRTGSLQELRHAKADRLEDRIQYGSKGRQQQQQQQSVAPRESSRSFMPPPAPMRRTTVKKGGPKRGLAPPSYRTTNGGGTSGGQKSNDDFRRMFLTPEKKEDEAGKTNVTGEQES